MGVETDEMGNVTTMRTAGTSTPSSTPTPMSPPLSGIGGGFDPFFDEHYDRVVRSLSLITADRARAEDAAQEAFATAYRKWPMVAGLDRPVGWVVVVATNHLKRWFTTEERRLQRFRSAGIAAVDDLALAATSDPATEVVIGEALRDSLAALPPRQRAVVVLRYLCDLSTDEVADALGCPNGTVKSTLHRALATLRVELAEPVLGEPGTDGTGAGR